MKVVLIVLSTAGYQRKGVLRQAKGLDWYIWLGRTAWTRLAAGRAEIMTIVAAIFVWLAKSKMRHSTSFIPRVVKSWPSNAVPQYLCSDGLVVFTRNPEHPQTYCQCFDMRCCRVSVRWLKM